MPANETTNVLVRPFLLVYYSTMNTLPNVPHMLPSVTYVCMLIPVIPHVMQEYVMILKMDSRSHYTYANTIIRRERQSMYACNISKVWSHGAIDNDHVLTRSSKFAEEQIRQNHPRNEERIPSRTRWVLPPPKACDPIRRVR